MRRHFLWQNLFAIQRPDATIVGNTSGLLAIAKYPHGGTFTRPKPVKISIFAPLVRGSLQGLNDNCLATDFYRPRQNVTSLI